jgi:hypothetical protein
MLLKTNDFVFYSKIVYSKLGFQNWVFKIGLIKNCLTCMNNC